MAHTQLITLRHLAAVFLLAAGLLPAGAQQWHTTIEISYPAELSLPLTVDEVLLVNNTVAHPDIPNGAFYTLMAASELLEGSDYRPSVLETSQNASASLYRRQLLSDLQADSLMQAYNNDALIVLNQLIVHPNSECFLTDDGDYYAYMQAVAASHWTIYFRQNTADGTMNMSAQNKVYADTLYWETTAETAAEATRALPSADEVRSEMCVYAGEHFALRYLPQTDTEDRYLYDLGKEDQGMQYFTRKQWQQAIDAWSQPNKDKKLTAYSEANCAVAYEILGNLAAAYAACTRALTALEAMRSADARQQAVNIRYYQEQLRTRMTR